MKKNAHDQNIEKTLEKYKRVDNILKKNIFEDLVVGPISKYVKLNNSKWFKPASIVLKKSLDSFIVFNNNDKVKLIGIFKGLGVGFTVSQLSSKNPLKNLNTNTRYTTLLNVLDIENEIVKKHLIISHAIEQIILFEDRIEAHSVIKSNPRSVECAYTISGDKIKLSNGSLTDFRQKDDGIYWFEDKKSKIMKYEAALTKINPSFECKKKHDLLINSIGSLGYEIDKIEKRIASVELELESMLEFKENDTAGLEKKAQRMENSIKIFSQKKAELEERVTDIEKRKTEIIKKNQEEEMLYSQNKEKNRFQIYELDRKIIILESKKRSKSGEISVLSSQVDIDSKEPNNIRTMEELELERKKIYEFRAKAKNMENKDIIVKKVSELSKQLDYLISIAGKFKQSLIEADQVYGKRLLKKEQIKTTTTEESIKLFQKYTKANGYDGVMTVDHAERKLEIKMRVHDLNFTGSKSTLSGGERSYAFVCLLLSLWSCFKCPVKILDEFDVFMDAINRKTAIRSVLDFLKNSETQVILITPLNTNDLVDPDVDIMVLKK